MSLGAAESAARENTTAEHRYLLEKSEEECSGNLQLLQNLEAENLRLEYELSELTNSAAGKQATIKDERKQLLAELTEKFQNASEESVMLKMELEKLEQDKEATRSEQKNLQIEMAKSNSELEAAQRELDDLAESLRKVVVQCEAVEAASKSLDAEDRVDASLGRVENAVLALEVEVLGGTAGSAPGSPPPRNGGNLTTHETVGIKDPFQQGPSGALAGVRTSSAVWYHVRGNGGRAGWVLGEELLQFEKETEQSSVKTLEELEMACPAVHKSFEKRCAALQEEDDGVRRERETITNEVETLKAEFVQFRQATAHALQVNSSLRTNLTEAEKVREKLRLDKEMMDREREAV